MKESNTMLNEREKELLSEIHRLLRKINILESKLHTILFKNRDDAKLTMINNNVRSRL